ncbi:MAG: RHS repeat-associated core domain-containing protein [Planctomycetota bacterium]
MDGVLDADDAAELLNQAFDQRDLGTLSLIGNTAGYTGHQYSASSGLHLARHRWLDPSAGRWVNRDPSGYVDGNSLYAYAMGDPITYVDPYGNTAIVTAGASAGREGRKMVR